MNDFSKSTEIAPLQRELAENYGISFGKHPSRGQPQFNDLPANFTSAKERNHVIPGRGDLRISLTSACNLSCSYCHNEGPEAPWLQAKTSAMLGNIEKLFEVTGRYSVKSVKFSGGDPGVYPHFLTLMDAIADWRQRYLGIAKWGMCTNGVPLVNAKKFQALVASRLDNINIGIDLVEPGERSKPLVGIPRRGLIDKFVSPLLKQNGVMGAVHTVRSKFFELIAKIAEEFRLERSLYRPLNEINLYDEQGNRDSAAIGIPLSAKVCVAFLFVGLSLAGCTAWRHPNGVSEVATSTTGAPSYAPSSTSLAPAANPQIRNVGTARPAGGSAVEPNLLKVAEAAAPIPPMAYKAPSATAPSIIAPPEFTPWPPARPSSYYLYPDSYLQPFRNRPIEDLLDDIRRRNEEAGYPPGCLLSVPAGFALALPFERIDDKGYPRTINRWVTDTRWFAPENIVEVILRIFIKRIDHYRQFIFVLTSDGSQSKKYPESFDKQKELCRDGHLFYDFSTTQVMASSHLYVLIYEYSVEKKDEPKLLTASQVLGRDHLSNSKILPRS